MNKLSPKDLRINNLLELPAGRNKQRFGAVYSVLYISEEIMDNYGVYHKIKNCNPIPITKTVLINWLGFILSADQTKLGESYTMMNEPKLRITLNKDGAWLCSNPIFDKYIQITYVHELQNFYHTIHGIDMPVATKDNKELLKQAEDKFYNLVKRYPGTKKGLKVEFDNYRKKYRLVWMFLINELEEGFNKQLTLRLSNERSGKTYAPWKNLSTYINQRAWEEELVAFSDKPKFVGNNDKNIKDYLG